MIDCVHLITSLERGGAQRMLLNLLRHLDRQRFACRVMTLVEGGGLQEEVARLDVPVESLGMRPGVPDPRALFRLRRKLETWRPRLLQTWLYHADILGALALRRGGNTVLSWNVRRTFSPATERGVMARIAPRWSALLSPRALVVIANSEEGRRTHQAIGYRPAQWRVIPNGFDLERYRPEGEARSRLLQELGLDADVVLAGMAARLHPAKNHAGLLEVAHRLAARLPKLRFVLVGAGVTRENPAFRGLLGNKVAPPPNVIALGERRDMPYLMSGFDFLVSPSLAEGFPNVLGEALACGTPCVATAVGDSSAVVGPGGTVVSPTGPGDLEEAIVAMVSLGAGGRAALGEAGHRHVAENFEMSAVARRYQLLYEELCGGGACVD